MQERDISCKLGFPKPFVVFALFMKDLNLKFNVDSFEEITNHFLQTDYHPRLLINNYEAEELCLDPPHRTELVFP